MSADIRRTLESLNLLIEQYHDDFLFHADGVQKSAFKIQKVLTDLVTGFENEGNWKGDPFLFFAYYFPSLISKTANGPFCYSIRWNDIFVIPYAERKHFIRAVADEMDFLANKALDGQEVKQSESIPINEPKCKHNWRYMGIVFDHAKSIRAGSGARDRNYYERYYCTVCLEKKDMPLDFDGSSSYDKLKYGATPR